MEGKATDDLLQVQDLYCELRYFEDDVEDFIQDKISALGPYRQEIVGAPPQAPTRKGAAIFEEIAAICREISQRPNAIQREVAQACILLVAACGIPWEQLSSWSRPLTEKRWPDPNGPGASAPGPGLLLYKTPELTAWQGIHVRPMPDLFPSPPAGTPRSLLQQVQVLAPIALAPALAECLASLILSIPGARIDNGTSMKRLYWPDDAFDDAVASQMLARVAADAPPLSCQPHRIANALGMAMRDTRVDPAIRALMTGIRSTETAIPAYYTAVSTKRLSLALVPLQDQLACILGHPPSPPLLLAGTQTTRVGSRRAPSRATTLRAIAEMERHLRQSRPARGAGFAGYAHYHNALVNRFALLMHVTYGLRRNRNSLCEIRIAELGSGYFTIQDKGLPRRQLPVTHGAEHALAELMAEGEKMWEIATALGRSQLAREIDPQKAQDHADRLMQMIDPAAPDGNCLRPWEPANLDHCLASMGVAVPTQLWRHALRTDLVDMEIDPSDIAAVLGHVKAGRGVWCPTSMEIPAEHLPRLRSILEARLALLGA